MVVVNIARAILPVLGKVATNLLKAPTVKQVTGRAAAIATGLGAANLVNPDLKVKEQIPKAAGFALNPVGAGIGLASYGFSLATKKVQETPSKSILPIAGGIIAGAVATDALIKTDKERELDIADRRLELEREAIENQYRLGKMQAELDSKRVQGELDLAEQRLKADIEAQKVALTPPAIVAVAPPAPVAAPKPKPKPKKKKKAAPKKKKKAPKKKVTKKKTKKKSKKKVKRK